MNVGLSGRRYLREGSQPAWAETGRAARTMLRAKTRFGAKRRARCGGLGLILVIVLVLVLLASFELPGQCSVNCSVKVIHRRAKFKDRNFESAKWPFLPAHCVPKDMLQATKAQTVDWSACPV